MAQTGLTDAEMAEIDRAVAHFEKNRGLFETAATNLLNSLMRDKRLQKLVHSSKYRIKDPTHLREKLIRKAIEAKEKTKKPNISAQNLFTKVGDLAGVRLLHLHTEQFALINEAVTDVLDELRYKVVEGPVASTWDDEYRDFFESIGVKTTRRESLYTSVHYVIDTRSRSKVRSELQVRTLMEEAWGEVSHKLNYPHETKSVACKEQLKVLARVTSAGTRLVDSVFRSQREHDELIGTSAQSSEAQEQN